MAHIPSNANWYVAELVEELTVEGEPRNVVHRNLTLIRGNSPEDAYAKAIALGEERNLTYDNPDRKKVTVVFHGLGSLNVIHDELEHGAEILYTEDIGVSKDQIANWIPRKEQLAVFRTNDGHARPDYSSGEVMEKVKRLL
jgi:hypothetical protein